MALITLSYGSAASGRLNGVVFLRTRGGQAMRNWVKPLNPNTDLQLEARYAMTRAVHSWRSLLDAQRATWNAYAAGTPVIGRMSSPIYLTGQQMYVRSQALWQQYPGSIPATVDDGPATPGEAIPATPPVPTITAGAGVSVAFTNTDYWATAVGRLLWLRISRPQAPTRTTLQAPFRFLAVIAGAVVPPVSPTVIGTNPWAGFDVAGLVQYMQWVVLLEDGRLSPRSMVRSIIA